MKVYFSHGKESGPWGSKITTLAKIAKSLDFTIESIDYTDILDNPDLRVERLETILKSEKEEIVLVGSSMGGYVSLVAAEHLSKNNLTSIKGIFLLAPALYISGYQQQKYEISRNIKTEIVHGWSDNVIPIENSIKFAESSDCSLHLISGDHRLNSSTVNLKRYFSLFLQSIKN